MVKVKNIHGYFSITIIWVMLAAKLYQGEDLIFQEECTISTASAPKAKGFNVIVYYPCGWKEQATQRPTLIKQYVGGLKNSMMSVSVEISEISNNYKTKDLTEDWFKERLKTNEEFISYRQYIAGRQKAVEIITSLPVDQGWYMYYHSIESIYDDKLLSIIYAVAASNKKDADKLFESKKAYLSKLADKLQILN